MSKRQLPPTTDPYAERETQKYGCPIPSREYIMQHLAYAGVPMTLGKLARLLKLKGAENTEALRRRLQAMRRDGQIIKNRKKLYVLAKKVDLISGRVVAHPDGYGFLVPDESQGDLFLSEKEMRSLLHGDRVLVKVVGTDCRGRHMGALVEILDRNTHQIVGRFFHKKGVAYVEPDNARLSQKVLIPARKRGGAKHGQIVVAQLIVQPTASDPPIGQIIEVMGQQRKPGIETEIAIRAYELPYTWPATVLTEIEPLTEMIPASEYAKRRDLRAILFVTIDGETAQDFDDAVYCEPRGKGWRLLVAIADVSAYVKPGTALDNEAYQRGNSVYFPNKVIPMLPEVLSNGLCSLKPQVDRLAVVCELFIDFYGRIRKTQFSEAVICSVARLTYTAVNDFLTGQTPMPSPLKVPLENLYALYTCFRKRRQKRGAIDFDTIETQIIFNAQQKIERIVPVVRNEAHKLIEEMMLVANVATAEWLKARQIPLLYRVHEGPTADKLTDLQGFLGTLQLKLGGGENPQASHYAKLVNKTQDRPEMRLIQTVLLRSMQVAIYNPENKGHFGLAYPAYTHFTSPIRRYPDLLTHRAIKQRLQGKSLKKFPYSTANLLSIGEHCTMTERRAEEATRDVISRLKCEYMEDKVGETFTGMITGVTSFGLFVEITDIFAEGLVHISTLVDDYYHFDPVGRRLYGENSTKVYRLSDTVRVKVIRVDSEEKKVDFELV